MDRLLDECFVFLRELVLNEQMHGWRFVFRLFSSVQTPVLLFSQTIVQNPKSYLKRAYSITYSK